jgi:hypothetical protein
MFSSMSDVEMGSGAPLRQSAALYHRLGEAQSPHGV